MRKVIYPVANGGAPINGDRFGDIWLDPWTALEAIHAGHFDPTDTFGVIVSGCKITGAGPYNCSAGIVYLNGQFMAFPGFTNQTLPQYIVPAAVVNITKTFANGSSNNLIAQQDATFQNTIPGSGQYINLTTSRCLSFARGIWTPVTLINSWANIDTDGLKWRLNSFGKVEFRGQIKGNGAATFGVICGNNSVPEPYFIIGSAVNTICLVAPNTATGTYRQVTINKNSGSPGVITIISFVNTDVIDFSGLSYQT